MAAAAVYEHLQSSMTETISMAWTRTLHSSENAACLIAFTGLALVLPLLFVCWRSRRKGAPSFDANGALSAPEDSKKEPAPNAPSALGGGCGEESFFMDVWQQVEVDPNQQSPLSRHSPRPNQQSPLSRRSPRSSTPTPLRNSSRRQSQSPRVNGEPARAAQEELPPAAPAVTSCARPRAASPAKAAPSVTAASEPVGAVPPRDAAQAGQQRHKPQEANVEVQEEASPAELALLTVLNLATLDDILALKGVGPKSAKAIIAFRESGGNLERIDDLVAKVGLTKKIVSSMLKSV